MICGQKINNCEKANDDGDDEIPTLMMDYDQSNYCLNYNHV
jgi:hypothetical protein